LRTWEEERWPRRAGVGSFGIGGTNAHGVLEGGPPRGPAAAGPAPEPARPLQILVLSARSEEAVAAAPGRPAGRPRAVEGAELPADTAYTLAVGRKGFGVRRAVVAADPATAREALTGRDPERLREGGEGAEAVRRPVAFLFPGQGSQSAGMGAELYCLEPVF